MGPRFENWRIHHRGNPRLPVWHCTTKLGSGGYIADRNLSQVTLNHVLAFPPFALSTCSKGYHACYRFLERSGRCHGPHDLTDGKESLRMHGKRITVDCTLHRSLAIPVAAAEEVVADPLYVLLTSRPAFVVCTLICSMSALTGRIRHDDWVERRVHFSKFSVCNVRDHEAPHWVPRTNREGEFENWTKCLYLYTRSMRKQLCQVNVVF